MMTERYLVPATLTDEQCDSLEEALFEAEDIRDPFDKWLVICRAIGTPVEAGEMEVVGYLATRPDAMRPDVACPDMEPHYFRQGWTTAALVRQSDAFAQIASRDKLIAEQRTEIIRTGTQLAAYRTASREADAALLKRIESFRTENERLHGVPAAIAQAVAELPDRSSPGDAPDMMLVTADELASIVRAAIDAAMGREGRDDG